MPTDWNEARLDRLDKRIDRIEKERRDEKQRSFERWSRTMLCLIWLMTIAIVVLTTIRVAS